MLCVALAEDDPKEIDFFTKQARLQIEARMALAQAKDIAHMQMEVNINHNQSLAALFSSVNQFARVFFLSCFRWSVRSKSNRQSPT